MAKLIKQENIEYEQLRGIEKAAVLVNYLGKDSIKVLFAMLDDGDVRKLLNVMQKFRIVPVHVTKKVLEEYYELISETDDYIFSENVFCHTIRQRYIHHGCPINQPASFINC